MGAPSAGSAPAPAGAVQRAKTSTAGGAADWANLPEDVLVRCFLYLTNAIRDVLSVSSVCQRWHSASAYDVVWLELARRRFWVLPVLCLAEDVRNRPSVCSRACTVTPARAFVLLRTLHRFVRRTATVVLSGGRRALPPPIEDEVSGQHGELRAKYVQQRAAVRAHLRDVWTQREVLDHTPYVLHALLMGSWLAAWIFMVLLILIHEGLWLESHPLTYNHAFGVLYTCYFFWGMCALVNVVATSHYEPMPLPGRVAKHGRVIALTFFLLIGLFVVSFATRMIHRNVVLPADERSSWLWCFSPAIFFFAAWQMMALAAIAPDLRRWVAAPRLPTAAQVYSSVLVTAYPLYCALSMVSLVLYLDGLGQGYLLVASVPWFIGTLLLTATFTIDWYKRRRFADGVCSVCLASLSLFPGGYIVWPEPRGLHMLPIVIALTAGALPYAAKWQQKATLDRRRALLRDRWATIVASVATITAICAAVIWERSGDARGVA